MANVRVAVRVRPLSGREEDMGARNIITTHGNSLSITNIKVEGLSEYGDSRDRVKNFTFDYCYDSNVDRSTNAEYASQELVYQDLGTEVLQAAFDGYNACLFAYGQTGTGKTYTMMGYPGEIGLTPRICEGLFSHVDDCPEENITFRVEISYLEIYNEKVRDLLRSSRNPERFTLRVREHPKEGPYVQDLTRHKVKDYHEVQTLLDRGNQLRTTASTHMHEHSSRSHAIVTVNFTQAKLEDGMPSETVSKVHLVDLAGSERADPNYHANYKGRITEGANINKSLYTLGYVIKALAEKSLLAWSTDTVGSSQSVSSSTDSQSGGRSKTRPLYIPYRDSVLTWLLKDSLGGNSKTLMIATITPASQYYSESISTLRYAQRAKSIVNQPRVNEDANVSLIRQLRQEIERLKQLLASAQMTHNPQLNEILYLLPGVDRFLAYSNTHSDGDSEEGGTVVAERDSGAILSEKLKENEAMANQLTQSWLNKWNETQTLMQDTDLSIRGLGRRSSSYGVIIDSQLPHLIGMDDDILSTGVIIFHLKEGKTSIGREDARKEQDIVLDGPGIQKEHCHVRHEDGQVILHPHHGAQCSVNGVLIHQPTALTQGDVLLLGQTNMYRFNNPAQAAKLRQRRQSQQEGELLSGASSVASLSDIEMSRATPLRMFNPRLESAQICLELEHAYASEDERIQHARSELERVRADLSVQEEVEQEEEERLWAEHERHREELEAEKIRLAHFKDRLLRMEQEAQESLNRQRQQLLEKEESYKEDLQYQLVELTHSKEDKLERGEGDSRAQQTDSAQLSSSAIQTDHATADIAITTDSPGFGIAADTVGASADTSEDAAISGPVGQEIQQRRQSAEGKVKGLAQIELLRGFSHQQAIQELQNREREIEEEIILSREEVESRRRQIQELEEQYRDADALKLDKIRQQKEQLVELHRQEEQLELYLEEKQELQAVGQAQPQPLRGAHSELQLSPRRAVTDTLGAPATRATSEGNVGKCADSVSDTSPSDDNMSDSRESLDASPEPSSNVGFYLPHSSDSDQSMSFRHPTSESVEMQQDEHSDLSQSLDSEMGSEEAVPDTINVCEGSDLSGLSAAGRGRTRVRSGRGKPRPLQSQGQSKPETAGERKLTPRAEEVTARLYQPKPSRAEFQGKFLRSKREKDVTGTSYSPPPVRKSSSSPSPKPLSKSMSPRFSYEGKRGESGGSPEIRKKIHNREEWRRILKSDPEVVDKNWEEKEPDSPSRRSLDRNRDNWDRPWRQGMPPPSTVSKPIKSLQSPRTPPTMRKGINKTVSGKGSITLKSGSKDAEDATKDSATAKPSSGADDSINKQNKKEPLKDLSPKSNPKLAGKSIETKSALKQSREGSRKGRLSGSDSSLLSSQQQPYRPRSRTRQISSASSLPSVPEAAAEGDTDIDSASMTSEPNMADLVAAVPRRQRRGRQSVKEQEERPHSEPVGDKWAQALAQYTAEMESGMGREELHRMEYTSPASSLEYSDSGTTKVMDVIPHIRLTEASSSSSDVDSPEESLQSGYTIQSREASRHEELDPSELESTDVDHMQGTDVELPQMPTHRVGDKREHGAGKEMVSEVAPKKKKADSRNEDDSVMASPLPKAVVKGNQDKMDVFILHAHSGCEVKDIDQGNKVTSTEKGDSDGSYSPDSLDEGDEDLNSHKRSSDPNSSEIVSAPKQTESNISGANISYAGADGPFILHQDHSEGDRLLPHDLIQGDSVRAESGELKTSVLRNSASTVSAAANIQPSDSKQKQDYAQVDVQTGAAENKGHPDFDVSSLVEECVTSGEDVDQYIKEHDSRIEVIGHISVSPQINVSPHTCTSVQKNPGQMQPESNPQDLSASGDVGPEPLETTPVFPQSFERDQNETETSEMSQRTAGHRDGSFSNLDVTEEGATTRAKGKQGDSGSRKETLMNMEATGTGIRGREAPVTVLSSGELSESGREVPVLPGRDGELLVTAGSGKEVPVSMEVLSLLAEKEQEGSQLSDVEETSSSHVEKQIQAWQEVLHHLSPRTRAAAQTGSSNNSTHHPGNGRRGKRRQHSRHLETDSDNTEQVSDDVLASGPNSRSSSRPSSGSRRRRRPASKASDPAVKKIRGHSSEEYVSSDNNSIFSDDSLTHSSERHETSASQISELRTSIQQLTTSLDDGETVSEVSLQHDQKENTMESEESKTVPALVSYFESQVTRPQDRVDGKELSPGVGQGKLHRESSVSPHSDEGHSSANEATQTEGGSVVMGKAPVSVLSAGDPNYVVSSGILQAMSGNQSIQEVSAVGAQSRRSWKLSIAPTDSWQSPETQKPMETVEEQRNRDSVQLRRKSKVDSSNDNPEKRQRQDKLTDLHSKYGLMDEVDHLSDEDDLQGTATATSRQNPVYPQTDPPPYESVFKKIQTAKKDSDGKLLFEVTINQDETNVLYNVETTEYKTYALTGNGESVAESSAVMKIPESININLTETTTLQREDRFETVIKERVVFDRSGKNTSNNDVVFMEHTVSTEHMIDSEQDKHGGNVSRESSVERMLTDEESSLKVQGSKDMLIVEQSASAKGSACSPVLHSNTTIQSVHMPSTTSRSLSSDKQRDMINMGSRYGKSSPSDPSNAASMSASVDLPKRVVLRREDINSTFRRNESGSVAGQLHQTIEMHQNLSRQHNTLPLQAASSEKASASQHQQLHTSPQVTSLLQMDHSLPDTPPPVKNKASMAFHGGLETSKSPASTVVHPLTTVRSQEGMKTVNSKNTVGSGPRSRSTEQAVEIQVIHQHDEPETSKGVSQSNTAKLERSDALRTDSSTVSREMTRQNKSVSQADTTERTWDDQNGGVDMPDRVGRGYMFFPVESWLSIDGAESQQSKTGIKNVSQMFMDTEKKTHQQQSMLACDKKPSQQEERELGSENSNQNVGTCLSQRQSRPSVDELPLESVERLPQAPVEYGPQPITVYPYCRDGLLLYTSTSCSEEPYSWIDTFREEAGIAPDITSTPRRSRLASEKAAEALLTEVKRRRSTVSQDEEEEWVFYEETVFIPGQHRPSVFMDHSQDEQHQENLVGTAENSLQNTVSSQDSKLSDQRLLNQSSTENVSAESIQNPDLPSDLLSRGQQLTPHPENVAYNQHEFCSTPLSQTAALPNLQSSVSSDSAIQDKEPSQQPDDSNCTSTEDSFHSPNTTIHNSSDSSAYRTPQESPREHTDHDSSFTLSDVSTIHANQEINSGQVMKAETNALKAAVTAVGRELVEAVGTSEVDAIREVLKQEVERKIARLERRVRSLSDSAISSDFTDPESTSVSPRSSRIPVSDINMESIATEATFYRPAFLYSAQEVFHSSSRENDNISLLSERKRNDKLHEKSLEDSGNIHDDQWLDNVSGQKEDYSPSSASSQGGKPVTDESDTRHTSPHDLIGATRTHHASSPVTGSNLNRTGVDKLLASHDGFPTRWETQINSQLPTPNREAFSHDSDHTSSSGKSQQPSYPGSEYQPTNRLSKKVVGVVDAVLSVQQSWPSRAFESYSHLRRKRRGLLGRKTKSLNNLKDLAAAQEYSHLEQSLLEQARLILQAGRVEGVSDTTSPAISVWHESKHTERENLAGGQCTMSVSHQATAQHEVTSLSDADSDRRASAQFENDDPISNKMRSSGSEAHTSEQAVRYILNAAFTDSTGSQIQPIQTRGNDDHVQRAEQGAVSAESATTSALGNTTALASSVYVSDGSHSLSKGRKQDYPTQSPHADSDGEVSDECLLTSGELEVATINARAAVRNFRPQTDTDSDSRALSPGEEILAEILARQFGVAADDSTPIRLEQLRIRGASPLRRPSSRREVGFSQEEVLCLPQQTAQHLEHVQGDLERPDAVESLLQSSLFQNLDSEALSGGQQQMLRCKALSSSSLGYGRYLSEEDQRDFMVSQMERPASLACLEGLVLEDSPEDGNSSVDSICFVFMDQKTAESTRLQTMGSSLATSDGSIYMITHSRSTENIPFDGEGQLLPFSEHSASMDNIYSMVSSCVGNARALHRSRSTSLLDVAANTVRDTEANENIFPPHVCTDSENSLDGISVECPVSNLTTDTDVSESLMTITNPSFIHRASLVEPTAEQHLYLNSPTQLYTSKPPGAQTQQFKDGETSPPRFSAVLEVESGQPYFRYRTPGMRPQQSESGAQTEKETICEHNSMQQTDGYQAGSSNVQTHSQSTELVNSMNQVSTSAAGRIFDSSERSQEVSPVSLDVSKSAATKIEHVVTPVSEASGLSVSVQQREGLGQRVETGTQTPTLTNEPFSPQVLFSRYPAIGMSLEPQTIIIKVKDALTQTGSSLSDLSTTEAQTDSELDVYCGSIEDSLRPSTRDSSSIIEGSMKLTSTMSQTDDVLIQMSSTIDMKDASCIVNDLRPSDSLNQTFLSSETAVIQRETRDASSNYMLRFSDTHSHTDFSSGDRPTQVHSANGRENNSRPDSYSRVVDSSQEAALDESKTDTKSAFTLHSDRCQVSVCTQLSVDLHARYIAVGEAREATAADRDSRISSRRSSQERGELLNAADQCNEEDIQPETYTVFRDRETVQELELPHHSATSTSIRAPLSTVEVHDGQSADEGANPVLSQQSTELNNDVKHVPGAQLPSQESAEGYHVTRQEVLLEHMLSNNRQASSTQRQDITSAEKTEEKKSGDFGPATNISGEARVQALHNLADSSHAHQTVSEPSVTTDSLQQTVDITTERSGDSHEEKVGLTARDPTSSYLSKKYDRTSLSEGTNLSGKLHAVSAAHFKENSTGTLPDEDLLAIPTHVKELCTASGSVNSTSTVLSSSIGIKRSDEISTLKKEQSTAVDVSDEVDSFRHSTSVFSDNQSHAAHASVERSMNKDNSQLFSTPSAVSQQLRENTEKENRLSTVRRENTHMDKKRDRGSRKAEGELSYRLEERIEMLPRPQFARLRRSEENYLLDSSFDDDAMFSSDAHQRAAWRARAGDFGPSVTPAVSPESSRRNLYSCIGDSSRKHGHRLHQRGFSTPLPQQADIDDEIERLRQEHSRMMELLERSRNCSAPLVSQISRTRSASPRMTHAESESSSSDSVVTVIAGRGFQNSPLTASIGQNMPRSHDKKYFSATPSLQRNVSHGGAVRKHLQAASSEESSLKNVTQISGDRQSDLPGSDLQASMFYHSVDQQRQSVDRHRNSVSNSSTGTEGMTKHEAVYGGITARTDARDQEEIKTETSGIDYALSRFPEERLSSSSSPDKDTADSTSMEHTLSRNELSSSDQLQTSLRDQKTVERQGSSATSAQLGSTLAVGVSLVSPQSADRLISRQENLRTGTTLETKYITSFTDTHPAHSTAIRRQHIKSRSVESSRSEQKLQSQDYGTAHIVSELASETEVPVTSRDSFRDNEPLSDVSKKTLRSILKGSTAAGSHHLHHPSFISTGVEATVNSSDDFTQTDAEDEMSLNLSHLNDSMASAVSGTNETRRIRAELDRLQQERVEIIELLSLQYLPGSLTVELLEAKMNYCLGQTDLLLATLEKAWSYEEPTISARYHSSRRHEEFLSQYKQQFEQSRQDLRICMEEARRIHSGARGRRTTRTRDVMAMRRHAQIEAFQQERRTEQALYDRYRNTSPDLLDGSRNTSLDQSDPGLMFAPRFMTPKQHKEHLVQLRRSVVAASSEELNELRERSRSSSFSRSPTPDCSISPVSSRSNIYPSHDLRLHSSLSPDRSTQYRSTASMSSNSTATRSYSAPGSRVSDISHTVPRLVLPSASGTHYRDTQSYSGLEPRSLGSAASSSRSCDPYYLAPPSDHDSSYQDVPSSSPSSRESVCPDPDQLLRESYEARQLNRQQINKAQEALRLLEQHRHGFRSHLSLSPDSRHQKSARRLSEYSQRSTSVPVNDQAGRGDFDSFHYERLLSPEGSARRRSTNMQLLQESSEPPKYTSTPRANTSLR